MVLGIRQGDSPSSILLNIIMNEIIKNSTNKQLQKDST